MLCITSLRTVWRCFKPCLPFPFSFFLFSTSNSCTRINVCFGPEFGTPIFFRCEMILYQISFYPLLFAGISKAYIFEGSVDISDVGHLGPATHMLPSTDLSREPDFFSVYSDHLPMNGTEVGIVPKAHHIGFGGALKSKQCHGLPAYVSFTIE